MPENPAILAAKQRLDRAKAALRITRGPYEAALKERDAALRDLELLRAPAPRTDYPLCG